MGLSATEGVIRRPAHRSRMDAALVVLDGWGLAPDDQTGRDAVADRFINRVADAVRASCALPGCYLVLRRMSLMGDAISHAVLPGLAAAFLITESRASLVMFLGAAAVGVLTALFVQWVHSFGRVDRGAAMGVVFTTLFAIGLIMIVRAARNVDLDPGCERVRDRSNGRSSSPT